MMTTKVPPPSPPYVGPARHTMGSNNKPISRVVIHATVGSEPGVKGAARGVAAMFRTTDRYASAHYVADASESVQVVYDSLIAEHAPPNQHSIGYELCCSLAGEGKGHWENADHQAMLKIVAKDVAQLCLAYDVPIVKVGPDELRAGKHGICGHIDVSNAWHETTHWDPGPYFPWDQFMGLVRDAAKALTHTPPPPPPPVKDSKPVTVRVGTWNAGDGAQAAKVDDLHRLESGVDVLLLSEFGDRGNVHPASGWNRFKGTGKPGQASTPIDYRLGLFVPDSVSTGSEFLTDARVVGRRGPGPSKLKPKWGNWVRGQLVGNGRWCRFVSFHGVPTPHLDAARESVGQEQVHDLAALVAAWQGEGLLVIGGDFNRDDQDGDLDVLEAAGMDLVSVGPTHGKHTLDLIYAKRLQDGDKRISAVDAKVVSGGSSDHESPWVALSVTAQA